MTMDRLDEALHDANERLIALAQQRVERLRAMERDLADRAAAQGREVVDYARDVASQAVARGREAVEGAVAQGRRAVEGALAQGRRAVDDLVAQGRHAAEDALAQGRAAVTRALGEVGRELGLREGLRRALALPEGAPRRDAIEAATSQLQRLGREALDAVARDGLVVGDVCIPCMERALREAGHKALDRAVGEAERQLRQAAARVEKRVARVAPEALRAINDALGTRIDFAALSRFDGAQWLRARVLPAVKKGVLVATGVDLSRWSARDLREVLKLPEALAARLDAYVGLVREKAAAALKELPLTLSRGAADALDRAVRSHVVERAAAYWDRERPPGAPSFRELTSGQQTALFSQAWRLGAEALEGAAARVYHRAAGSDAWRAVEAQLRALPAADRAVRERLDAEADLLRAEWDRLAGALR